MSKYRCRRETCSKNEDGKCEWPGDDCDKDLFICKKCEYAEWMNEPRKRERCPNCGTTLWDYGPDVQRRPRNV